jgi:hypothetical protein
MKIRVEMLAFGQDGEFREVIIPNDQISRHTGTPEILDLVYYFGQNDTQPLPHPSVSVGDVIHYAGEFWMVLPIGFRQVWDTGFLEEYRKTPRVERLLVAHVA